MENNNVVVIGVDNGFGMTKTVHNVFPTALEDYNTVKPSFMDNVVYYKGKYYIVGGNKRVKVHEDKTENSDVYILTLAAIGSELAFRGISGETHIVLSVGLPLERCGGGAQKFADYFLQENPVTFEYQDISYTVHIDMVKVSPQGYSAVAFELDQIKDSTVLVDIGSWTVDISQIQGNIPISPISLNDGVINCMQDVNNAIRREFGNEVPESQIQGVMRGIPDSLPAKYEEIAKAEIRKYVENLASSLQERKYNLDTLDFIFVGGGAILIKNFGMDLFPSGRVITEINSNAVGFEKIGAKAWEKTQAGK